MGDETVVFPGPGFRSIRLLMFEVWEADSDFPMFVTSDPTEAKRDRIPTDRIVKRHWVREGGADL